MAGSIKHVTAEDGSFTFDLIDNMGDAYEACAELFHEVERLQDPEYEAHAEFLEERVGRLSAEVDRLQWCVAGKRQEVERLRAVTSAFVAAFNQRFKPTGIEDEFEALCQVLGGGE
jgi:hypothetical protein